MVHIAILGPLDLQMLEMEMLAITLTGLKARVGLDISVVPHPEAPDWMKERILGLSKKGTLVLPFVIRGDGEMVLFLGCGVSIHGAYRMDGTDIPEEEGKLILESLKKKLGVAVPAAHGTN